ncbi:uncharacterized protein LOC128246202 [Mya arenaria]|uniref:uncharacterized protein LOC128246202 n=1 Tax=Mya arenaria TaxID=6604 RepID=UPI0022E6E33C|nr:uncharacterized protein LOC128246202 [Mya arenaria]
MRTTKVTAAAVTVLGLGGDLFKDSYQAAGEWDNFRASLRAPLEYLMTVYTNTTLIYKGQDEAYVRGLWNRPSDVKVRTYFPLGLNTLDPSVGGADIAAEVSAALAVGAKVFEDDGAFALNLTVNAVEMYFLSMSLNGSYNDTDSLYYSEGDSPDDERCVATWLLYDLTKGEEFHFDGMSYMGHDFGREDYILTWSDRYPLCEALLYKNTGNSSYLKKLQRGMEFWQGDTKQVTSTPDGLVWYKEQPLEYAGNAAFLAMFLAELGVSDSSLREFARNQINYMLGSNTAGMSYQVGFGEAFPLRPHHAASSCSSYQRVCNWKGYNSIYPNPNQLTGALVGGPDKSDFFEDVRSSVNMTRVSVLANAGFQSTLAGLFKYFPTTTFARAPRINDVFNMNKKGLARGFDYEATTITSSTPTTPSEFLDKGFGITSSTPSYPSEFPDNGVGSEKMLPNSKDTEELVETFQDDNSVLGMIDGAVCSNLSVLLLLSTFVVQVVCLQG